jgi:predicted ArsR family transcriptional regulator
MLPATASLVDRARELAIIQDEQGYLAQLEMAPDGTIRLVEHNCAIFEVAAGSARPCQAELEMFREVLGVEVVRDRHIASGDRCCSYRLGPSADTVADA